MENLTKALLMAAGVLITVLVISLAVYYFGRLRDFSDAVLYSKKEEIETKEYNGPLLFQEEKINGNMNNKSEANTKQSFGRLISALNYIISVNTKSEYSAITATVRVNGKNYTFKNFTPQDTESERKNIIEIIEYATITVTRKDTANKMYRTFPVIDKVKLGHRGRVEEIHYSLKEVEIARN